MQCMRRSVHRPEYNQLLQLVREKRVDAELTQEAVAASLGRPKSWLSDVERGIRRLDPVELLDLCEALGVDFEQFIGEWTEQLAAKPKRRRAVRPTPGKRPRLRS